MEPSDLFEAAVADGDRRALARLLRIVEDRREGWRHTLTEAWAASRSAQLVGVTGAPGSGKSTLTNAMITAWRAVDRSVGVVAVDPSSPFSGGALLGDRIRMQDHVGDPGVFIRSMSNRGRLGGLADTTAGLVTLLDAAAFDPVVIETVGVGQSEVEIIDHADTVVVVVTPGWGDGVQADKAGILEIGDVFVINKADRPHVEDTRNTLAAMLEMSPDSDWVPPIVETVATEDSGVEELLDVIDRHRRHLSGPNGRLRQTRRVRSYVEAAMTSGMRKRLDHPDLDGLVEKVRTRRLDPWTAAEQLVAPLDVEGRTSDAPGH
ncbi:methylmalonyl Co-A mutase-associated GTPase MeaB [soil metagenome]